MTHRIELILVDRSNDVVDAWRGAFAGNPNVRIQHGDILKFADDAIVSPANSYGYMDGGIDLRYVAYFGVEIQQRVQSAIRRRPEGHLPIGAAVLVSTGDVRIPHLIVTPTMAEPGPVPASNAYRALRAALRLVTNETRIERLYCPGLATGVGQVRPVDAATEMACAFADWRETT
ncbi:MAG TPA: macro domain-containing protein [Phycisphaerae bacterium]|nr:macro domain-containing protein [Phycisphaerae bacterium]HRW55244.1 macro domain-containing protein [Phycisphaerae bacterium]